MKENIKFKNRYGNCTIEVDCAEGGSFWIIEEYDDESMISIPFSEIKKINNFLTKWIKRIDSCKKDKK